MNKLALNHAVAALRRGQLIAYPTEAVFGLGCDPAHDKAVRRLMEVKQRPSGAGLVLVVAEFAQVAPWLATDAVSERTWQNIHHTWPGPVTWVIPASETAPQRVCGPGTTLAVRVSAHPVVCALCKAFSSPIVSTSANHRGETPLRSAAQVRAAFHEHVEVVLDGGVGENAAPCPIRDAVTGKTIRG